MKSIGVVRRLDPLGRIVIPKETRRDFSINKGSALEIFVEGESIVLKKYTPGCTFCGEFKDTTKIEGKCKQSSKMYIFSPQSVHIY